MPNRGGLLTAGRPPGTVPGDPPRVMTARRTSRRQRRHDSHIPTPPTPGRGMTHHELHVSAAYARAADTNTLLRLYDHVRLALGRTASESRSRQARYALDRITQELRRRGAAVNGGPA